MRVVFSSPFTGRDRHGQRAWAAAMLLAGCGSAAWAAPTSGAGPQAGRSAVASLAGAIAASPLFPQDVIPPDFYQTDTGRRESDSALTEAYPLTLNQCFNEAVAAKLILERTCARITA
jgi:hypothetical protein